MSVIKVKTGDMVTVHYTGKFENQQVFDSSKEREPLEFKVGDGQIIVGVEQAVIGMSIGELKTIQLNPSDAYGERRDDLISTIEKKHLKSQMNPGKNLREEKMNEEEYRINKDILETPTILTKEIYILAQNQNKFPITYIWR